MRRYFIPGLLWCLSCSLIGTGSASKLSLQPVLVRDHVNSCEPSAAIPTERSPDLCAGLREVAGEASIAYAWPEQDGALLSPRSAELAIAVVANESGLVAGSASAVARAAVLPHQALYEIGLAKSRDPALIDNARGQIVFRFTGNPCEGYTSEFHQVSELASGGSKVTLSELSSRSWEDADGSSYRFKFHSRLNDADLSTIQGIAERTGDQITVTLHQPTTKTFTLSGDTVFPTEQIRRIIAAAREGKSLLELAVYDGSDNGEKVYDTLTVIGPPILPDRTVTTPDPSTSGDHMKSLRRWPVTVNYYDREPGGNDQAHLPNYAMSFELFENGISRALLIDYNDIVLSGTLKKVEVEDAGPCK